MAHGPMFEVDEKDSRTVWLHVRGHQTVLLTDFMQDVAAFLLAGENLPENDPRIQFVQWMRQVVVLPQGGNGRMLNGPPFVVD